MEFRPVRIAAHHVEPKPGAEGEYEVELVLTPSPMRSWAEDFRAISLPAAERLNERVVFDGDGIVLTTTLGHIAEDIRQLDAVIDAVNSTFEEKHADALRKIAAVLRKRPPG